MKKVFTFVASAFIMAPALLQAADNVGLNQFATLSPTPGEVSLSVNESGLSGFNFSFNDGKGEVARDKDLFITCKRNGNVISQVPASNTAFVKYDGVYAHVWQVSLFARPNYECMAGGDYEITIPEGFFLIGDDKTPNSEIVINYYIAPSNVEIFPAEGRNFSFLQDFTITFGDAKSIEVNEKSEHKIEIIDMYNGTPDDPLTGGDEDDEPVVPADDPGLPFTYTINGNSITLHLVEPATTGSTYALTIPAGAINLIDENGNVTQNAELIYQYGIPKVGKGQPEITNVGSLAIEFPGVIELQLQPGETLFTINQMGANFLYELNEDGSYGDPIATFRAAAKNSSYYIDENKKPIPGTEDKIFLVNQLGSDVRIAPAPGMFALVTSNALYSVRTETGGVNFINQFTYTFEVIDGGLFNMEFTPEANSVVESLDCIKVKFPDAYEVKVNGGTSWLRSTTTSYQFYAQTEVEDDNTVVFKTGVPVTLHGDYRFTSNIGTVEVDGDCVGIVVEYQVNELSDSKQIAEAVVLPEKFDIINAQGMIIKRNANVNDLNELPAGIYIAGGKKIVNRW
ncbi:MAG: hypothetical protein K2M31_08225 [Muribaculaceae bacterium]|nr:hypothetical protein [Muribaculaceae bacterium]